MSLGGKKGEERGRKEGRDTRYNFEHNLFARVYICARILGETTKPRLSFLFAPVLAPTPPPPFFRPTSRERGSLFLRNMHELSGFILHVPRFARVRVLEERESSLHRKRKDRFVVTSISKTPPTIPL